MFDPITHPWVGTTRMFMPQGKSPYSLTAIEETLTEEPGIPVLVNGDAVTVESAWTRPYMARTAPTLLYVRSHRTGLATYVLESEVNLDLRALAPTLVRVRPSAMARALRAGRTPTVEEFLGTDLEQDNRDAIDRLPDGKPHGWAELEQMAKRAAELLDDPDRERKVWEMILAGLDSLVSETKVTA